MGVIFDVSKLKARTSLLPLFSEKVRDSSTYCTGLSVIRISPRFNVVCKPNSSKIEGSARDAVLWTGGGSGHGCLQCCCCCRCGYRRSGNWPSLGAERGHSCQWQGSHARAREWCHARGSARQRRARAGGQHPHVPAKVLSLSRVLSLSLCLTCFIVCGTHYVSPSYLFALRRPRPEIMFSDLRLVSLCPSSSVHFRFAPLSPSLCRSLFFCLFQKEWRYTFPNQGTPTHYRRSRLLATPLQLAPAGSSPYGKFSLTCTQMSHVSFYLPSHRSTKLWRTLYKHIRMSNCGEHCTNTSE